MRLLFADAYFFFALVNKKDQGHQAALLFAGSDDFKLVTTEWVLVEVADGLASPNHRHFFKWILELLKSDTQDLIVPASGSHFESGIQLYLSRADKRWSLTDCISFTVMREMGITDALTGDKDFEQAGFKRLLV